ncbi:unnamed protein product [Chrysoparadoxa australica]
MHPGGYFWFAVVEVEAGQDHSSQGQGSGPSLSHFSTSRWPPSAAAEQVRSLQGQGKERVSVPQLGQLTPKQQKAWCYYQRALRKRSSKWYHPSRSSSTRFPRMARPASISQGSCIGSRRCVLADEGREEGA